MVFGWLARRRRNKIRRQPFADSWLRIIEENVAYFRRLTAAEQEKLKADTAVFVAEKNWEGCNGLEMTDEVRVTVAAQMSLLCLGFTDETFFMVESILVYPDAYVAPSQTSLGGGVVLEGESDREGEAWYRGPVILSWADVLEDGQRDHDGNNLVLHEFAHQLDMQGDRVVNGTPLLSSNAQYHRWQQVVGSSYRRLVADCHRGHRTLIDCYGASDIGEFFAVATECFFEYPRALRQQDPNLYEIFAEYYRQDPASRFSETDATRQFAIHRARRKPPSTERW